MAQKESLSRLLDGWAKLKEEEESADGLGSGWHEQTSTRIRRRPDDVVRRFARERHLSIETCPVCGGLAVVDRPTSVESRGQHKSIRGNQALLRSSQVVIVRCGQFLLANPACNWQETRESVTGTRLACAHCGTLFEKEYDSQRYCCPEHSELAKRARARARKKRFRQRMKAAVAPTVGEGGLGDKLTAMAREVLEATYEPSVVDALDVLQDADPEIRELFIAFLKGVLSWLRSPQPQPQ